MDRTEHGTISQPLQVTDHVILKGMATAGATVGPGGSLDLDGMMVGPLVVEEGGSACVRGMVVGDVRNEGGQVAVFGMIVGRLVRTAGETSVDPDAVIKSAE